MKLHQTESLIRDFYNQKGQTTELLRMRANPYAGFDLKFPKFSWVPVKNAIKVIFKFCNQKFKLKERVLLKRI